MGWLRKFDMDTFYEALRRVVPRRNTNLGGLVPAP